MKYYVIVKKVGKGHWYFSFRLSDDNLDHLGDSLCSHILNSMKINEDISNFSKVMYLEKRTNLLYSGKGCFEISELNYIKNEDWEELKDTEDINYNNLYDTKYILKYMGTPNERLEKPIDKNKFEEITFVISIPIEVKIKLPIKKGNYLDFYHKTNKLFNQVLPIESLKMIEKSEKFKDKIYEKVNGVKQYNEYITLNEIFNIDAKVVHVYFDHGKYYIDYIKKNFFIYFSRPDQQFHLHDIQ